jgi:hypothetical protein
VRRYLQETGQLKSELNENSERLPSDRASFPGDVLIQQKRLTATVFVRGQGGSATLRNLDQSIIARWPLPEKREAVEG